MQGVRNRRDRGVLVAAVVSGVLALTACGGSGPEVHPSAANTVPVVVSAVESDLVREAEAAASVEVARVAAERAAADEAARVAVEQAAAEEAARVAAEQAAAAGAAGARPAAPAPGVTVPAKPGVSAPKPGAAPAPVPVPAPVLAPRGKWVTLTNKTCHLDGNGVYHVTYTIVFDNGERVGLLSASGDWPGADWLTLNGQMYYVTPPTGDYFGVGNCLPD